MNIFYILVLDKNSKGKEGLWYVTVSGSSLQLLRAVISHDDTIVMQLLQSLYPGDARDRVTLKNTHSNVDEQGTIYEVHHI
jgi:hypothetical protein